MSKQQSKLPISAIVVGYNEGHLIKNCLSSISFCDEILFFDLESSDNTIEVVQKIDGVTIISHKKVPFAEYIHCEFIAKAKHDWILLLDPDEEVSNALKLNITSLFSAPIASEIGGFIVPWIFYFKNKRLLGTTWGGVNKKTILVNRTKYKFSSLVHGGRYVENPFINQEIEFKEDNFVYHYWMSNYNALLSKHKKYLKFEPESRYKRDFRTSRKEILKTPLKAFKYSFIDKKGYKNKSIGLFLSLFWAWYETSSLIGLYRYQKNEYKKR